MASKGGSELELPERLFEKNFSSPLELANCASRIFNFDFEKNTVFFMGYKIQTKKYPNNNSFGFLPTFWHIITNGEHEDDLSAIDIERTTRIGWIRPILTEYDNEIKMFWEIRNRKPRICIVYIKMRYVIILEPRFDAEKKIKYLLLWSAFFIYPERNIYRYNTAHRNFEKRYGEFNIESCPFI